MRQVALLLVWLAIGTEATQWYCGPQTLDFPSTNAGASSDLTIDCGSTSGVVAAGRSVFVGVPPGSTSTNGVYSAWVSAADTVTVRFTNTNLVGAINPASGSFEATVWNNDV